MIAPLLGLTLSLVLLLCAFNAIVRSHLAEFWLGAAAGVLRCVLLVLGWWVALRVVYRADAGSPLAWEVFAFASSALGPVISFVTVFLAHSRMTTVVAREEEAASRPFMAWLPVAILDAVFALAMGLVAFAYAT
jgi:hypothetical protein